MKKAKAIAGLDDHTRSCITGLMDNLEWPADFACDWLLAETEAEKLKVIIDHQSGEKKAKAIARLEEHAHSCINGLSSRRNSKRH